ncbi:GNAT family N-acetyltransferase [Dankookia rubra]
MLDKIRSEGAKVVAQCEFVAAFMERYPGYQSLAADK